MGYEEAGGQGLARAVERALVKPRWCRSYRVSRAEAHKVYGIDGELADVLAGMGFPCEGRGDQVAFDPLDCENLGLDLGLASASRAAMSLWARSFRDPDRLATARCTVQMSWSCPSPGHPGECEVSVSPRVGGRWSGPVARDGSGWNASLDVRLLNDDHVFDGAFSVLVEEAEKLHFHRLTPELAQDMGFLREHRIADCRSASIHLAAVAAEAGLAVRQASGYFVAAPFLVPHIWIDVEVDGRWVAADPFFLRTLARWGVVSAQGWPPTRSPRNVLWRVRADHDEEPLVRHGAVDVPVQLVARRTYEHRV